MNVLLDTNVLLRMAEPAHLQYQHALDATDHLGNRGHTLCLVPQNFYEFWVVSTRPLPQNGRGKTPAEVAAEFSFLESHFSMLDEVPRVLAEWKRLVTTHLVTGKPAHDARFVAAMLAHGVSHILTFNVADFKRFPGITPLDPVTVAATAKPPTSP